MIKSMVRKAVTMLVSNRVSRDFFTATVIRFANYFEWEKKRLELDSVGVVNDIAPDFIVKNGPFKSLKFPHINFTYCPIIPMILGSYERELHGLIEQICIDERYTEIIDIGCAEGYYAVGLAMRLPEAKVYAFDIDEQAREMCKELADKNEVLDRLIIKGECTPSLLPTLKVRKRALVVVDCEGCEKHMFTKDNVSLMKKHDYLIEVHDCIDLTISQTIRDVFGDTHKIEVFQTIDDIKKAQTYNYTEIEKYTMERKKLILSEFRGATMEWFYITSLDQI